MEIKSGQQDVRSTFLRGSVGQIVAGIIWLLSTALGTWVSGRSAILVLVLGGAHLSADPVDSPSVGSPGRAAQGTSNESTCYTGGIHRTTQPSFGWSRNVV